MNSGAFLGTSAAQRGRMRNARKSNHLKIDFITIPSYAGFALDFAGLADVGFAFVPPGSASSCSIIRAHIRFLLITEERIRSAVLRPNYAFLIDEYHLRNVKILRHDRLLEIRIRRVTRAGFPPENPSHIGW